jgi:hypothetical protein
MERREVVNGSKENAQPDEWEFLAQAPSSITPTPYSITPAPAPQFPSIQSETAQFPSAESKSTQFPRAQSPSRPLCLYFGPAGERCYQPALDNGFCRRHQPNRSPTALGDEARARTKKAAAVTGVIAVLWPLIEELLRQIFRLFR